MPDAFDARTEALVKLAEVLSAERLAAWDRRLVDIDRILRGNGEGDGLVPTVRVLARAVEQNRVVLFGERGDGGLASVVRMHQEAIQTGKRWAGWVMALLVAQLLGTLTFLFRFLWEQVTGG